jgi:hypothetical protein
VERSLAWFPRFNQIHRAYAKEPYPLWTVCRHSVVLPLAGFALLIVYWGARLLAKLWGAVRERRSERRDPPELAGKTLMERARFIAEKARDEPTVGDRLLDEYAADVFNYINSAGDTFSPERNVSEELRHVTARSSGDSTTSSSACETTVAGPSISSRTASARS